MTCDHRSATGGSLVDVDRLAEQLAVSAGHVRWLVATRQVPYIDWGAGARFDPAAIDAWLAVHTHHPRQATTTAVVIGLCDRAANRRRSGLRLVGPPGSHQ